MPNIEGTSGNDTLNGTSADDTINGLGGNDTIFAGAGNDVVNGGAGFDFLFGEAGNDELNGGPGGDELYGDAGDDFVSGGDDRDGIYGNAGNDTLDGGGGNDVMDGGEGDDIISGGADGDELTDTSGNNTLHGGDGNDSLRVDGVIDVNARLYFTNHLFGGSGDDGLIMTNSNGTLSGGDGNDFLAAYFGTTSFDGGVGDDTLSMGRTFFLGLPDGIQTATGGLGADIFQLNPTSNLAEVDRILDFNSGEGDRISLVGIRNGQVVDPFGWAGGLSVMFGGELDATLLSTGSVLPDSGVAFDVIQVWYARLGATTYVVADSDASGTFDADDFVVELAGEHVIKAADFVVGTFAIGTPGDDVLSGGDQNDQLDGFGGDDILAGGGGSDILNGGDGNDTLYSGIVSPTWNRPQFGSDLDWVAPVLDHFADVDTLIGGAGIDRIYAGFGDIVDGGADLADLLISLRGATSGVTADFRSLDNGGTLTIGGNIISNIRSVLWIEGSDFDDTITGSNRRDDFGAFAPIFGLGGDDHLIAGVNTGNIYGGDGNDTIEVHQNYINGPGFNGTYFGDAGNDIIIVTGDSVSYPFATAIGGDGDDYLNLAGWIHGGAGNDEIIVAENFNYPTEAHGDAGDDTIVDSESSSTLFGGAGADTIEGNGGNDIIGSAGMMSSGPGWEGWDSVDRGIEHDELSGGDGDDTIIAGYGDDADGGTGFNGLSLSLIGASAGFTLNVADLVAPGPHVIGGGTIQNFDYVTHIFGSNFADTLIMSASLVAHGMGGNDTIIGTSGIDEIHGGAGADVITAGAGNDTIFIDDLNDVIAGEEIRGGDGIDTLFVFGIPGRPDGSFYDISGAVLSDVEVLMVEGVGTIGLTQSQLSSITTLGARDLYFTSGGAISMSGITALFSTVIQLNEAGNQLDLSGFSPSAFCLVAGGNGNDTVIGSSFTDDVFGNDGNDVLDGAGGSDFLNGGGGADTLTGGSGEDVLTGNVGSDTFRDTKAGLNGDTITDFSAGDKIVLTDATLAGFTYNLTGNTLTYSGGSLTLEGDVTGKVVVSAAAGGGVQLEIRDVDNDYNGDGISDVLWRHSSGLTMNWLGQPVNGGFVLNDDAWVTVGNDWHVAATGDFNGDGRDDIMWRNDSGMTSQWQTLENGSYVPNNVADAMVGTEWFVVGTGDFNGDGRDDVLWRSDTGVFTEWLAQPNGSFVSNDQNASAHMSVQWHVIGTGDFNGDGKDDVLWRHDSGLTMNWFGLANGGFVLNPDGWVNIGMDWHVVGIGDFNGDGRDDIMWRNDSGMTSQWQTLANGSYIANNVADAMVGNEWQVAGVGDYNGDGRDEVIWRNSNGAFTGWLAQPNGSFVSNHQNSSTTLPNDWFVQANDVVFL